jgi:hypothetical protein
MPFFFPIETRWTTAQLMNEQALRPKVQEPDHPRQYAFRNAPIMTEVAQPRPDSSGQSPHLLVPSAAASKKRLLRPWLIAIVLLAAIIGGALIGWQQLRRGSPVRYVTSPASAGPVTKVVSTTGTVNPELTIIVGSYVSGVIKDVYCDYNTQVKTGQVCAKIDPRPYQTAVDQARANLDIAKAQLLKDQASLTYAKATFDRYATLVKTNAVSADAYDGAKSTFEQAQAQVAYDKASIEQRQAALDAAQVNSTIPTSPLRSTAQWCRATLPLGRRSPRASRHQRCS